MESSSAVVLKLIGNTTDTLQSYYDNASLVDLSEIIPPQLSSLEWIAEWDKYSKQNIHLGESGGVQEIWNEIAKKWENGLWTFEDTHNGWQKLTQDCVMRLRDRPLCEMNIGLVIELVGQNETGWPNKQHKAKFVRDLVRLFGRVRRPVFGVVMDLCRVVCFRLDNIDETGVPQLFKSSVHSGEDVKMIMLRFASASPEMLGVVEYSFDFDGKMVHPKKIIGSGAQGTVFACTIDEEEYFIKHYKAGACFITELECLKSLTGLAGVPRLCSYNETTMSLLGAPIGKQILKYRGALSLMDWAIQLTGILQAVHLKGIVHRDIRASNIMIVKVGQMSTPLVIDFAYAVNENANAHYAGTIHYAPASVLKEILEGNSLLTALPWHDLESLVLTMWELTHENGLYVNTIQKNQFGEILKWWNNEATSNKNLATLLRIARAGDYESLKAFSTWNLLS